ncbi:hypothetical protein P22_3484 [Propionispora sp. 2/2-37]|uniref:hypothetical protein n=1 Tax=Propionispora sp. 2/2-37 TaxID=1677858 RepID=UPI0006BB6EF8|nr:hypothetical protein [Propionispora sp. 2/2-37]CUH97357.1 hypothetical protein P22_3484 [Propionispora sp. 2/2-37]
MTDTDKFMQEEFMPFYKRTFEAFVKNHSSLYAIAEKILSGKTNHIGIRITSNNTTIGEYTVYFNGATISNLENGVLSSEIHTPFGIIKPYVILEKNTVEKMIEDEPNFIKDPFTTKMKYAHDFTIKFLK